MVCFHGAKVCKDLDDVVVPRGGDVRVKGELVVVRGKEGIGRRHGVYFGSVGGKNEGGRKTTEFLGGIARRRVECEVRLEA